MLCGISLMFASSSSGFVPFLIGVGSANRTSTEFFRSLMGLYYEYWVFFAESRTADSMLIMICH